MSLCACSDDEIVISYLCCIVAIHGSLCDLKSDIHYDDRIDDFGGAWYMEDLFLRALYESMQHISVWNNISRKQNDNQCNEL